MPDDPTPRPLIAGYDGGPAAAAAVRFAAMVGAAAGAEVIAATVHRTFPYAFGPATSAAADSELTSALREDAERVLEGVDVPGVRREAVAGDSPAHGLHDLAEREGAQLVAVGATHRGAIGRLLVGGVGDRLLHGAPCPVAVVPEEWAAEGAETLGVAFDGRRESVVALRAAEDLARRLGASLELIGVYDPAPYLWLTSAAPHPEPWDVDDLHARFEQDLRDAAGLVDAAVPTRTRAVSGLPGPALVEASHGVDVLVTGSRGYGPIGGVLLGSVSRYAVDHAACPTVVVPRAPADAEGHTPRS